MVQNIAAVYNSVPRISNGLSEGVIHLLMEKIPHGNSGNRGKWYHHQKHRMPVEQSGEDAKKRSDRCPDVHHRRVDTKRRAPFMRRVRSGKNGQGW